jgi:ParE-like toxin of type II ParDE toxin-antitoxin system
MRYAQINPDLATDFQQAIEEAAGKIAASPKSWPKSRRNTHWVKTRRFPYLLFYRILDEFIVLVVAAAHERRRPGYWAKRLPS